jgi:DNase/tRNase domain of colicin-like bacteriocin
MKKNSILIMLLWTSAAFANNVPLLGSTNKDLEGRYHKKTGVYFERIRTQRHTGEVVDIVVPRFESLLDVQLPTELYLASDSARRNFLAHALKQAVDSTPALARRFTAEELIEIRALKQPKRFAWHDDAPVGKIQLVDRELHNKTGHTGGRWIWGGGTDNRS